MFRKFTSSDIDIAETWQEFKLFWPKEKSFEEDDSEIYLMLMNTMRKLEVIYEEESHTELIKIMNEIHKLAPIDAKIKISSEPPISEDTLIFLKNCIEKLMTVRTLKRDKNRIKNYKKIFLLLCAQGVFTYHNPIMYGLKGLTDEDFEDIESRKKSNLRFKSSDLSTSFYQQEKKIKNGKHKSILGKLFRDNSIKPEYHDKVAVICRNAIEEIVKNASIFSEDLLPNEYCRAVDQYMQELKICLDNARIRKKSTLDRKAVRGFKKKGLHN